MADEQIIYISPEEELTNVRERLERTAARRIILVIPPQTQLRSHVGWRLLHSRARELGKDVIVNSSDRQIRAVAKAAGFRVADSLESPSTHKSRPPSRPGRNVGGGKSSSRKPIPFGGRGTPENRPTSQRGAAPGGYVSSDEPIVTQLSPQPPQSYPETNNKTSRTDERTSEAGSSTFGSRDNSYGQDFEYRIDTAPSIHPLSPQFEDEEPDLLIEDFQQAQNIRQAAQLGDEVDASMGPAVPPPSTPSSYASTGGPHDLHDPFAYREDFPRSSLPEQRGSISMDELESDVPDIGDVPTSIIVDGEIEDLGDEGDIVSSPRSFTEPVMEEPEMAEPPRVYGMRPRNSLAGNLPPTPYEDEEREDEDLDVLLPPEQPIRAAPPAARVVNVPPSTVGNRPPQPIITPQPRTSPGAPVRRPVPIGVNEPLARGRSRTTPPAMTSRQAGRRNPRGITFMLIAIVLILVILGILLILIPSADITLTFPSQSFSTPVKVTATSTSRQDARLHTVPAHLLTFNGKIGPLTATTQVGGQASGFVAFTNKGAQPLTIPINTVVATAQGVQFLTQGEAVVPQASTLPAVQITARDAGTLGNVPIGAITVVPSDSINAIALASNIPVASVNASLTVSNPTATTGGKAGSNGSDLTASENTLKQMLHQQMQNQYKTWLKGQLHGQDQAGTATPALLGSSNPVSGETFSFTAPDPHGNFKGTETLQATVLVVRTADLQAAATPELNAALAASKAYRGDALVSPSSLTLSTIKSAPSKDGKSLSISFTAGGLIGPTPSQAQLDNLRSLLAGRKVADAQSLLKNNTTLIPGIISSQITLFPSFFSNIPFWTARINIHVQYHCTGKTCPKG